MDLKDIQGLRVGWRALDGIWRAGTSLKVLNSIKGLQHISGSQRVFEGLKQAKGLVQDLEPCTGSRVSNGIQVPSTTLISSYQRGGGVLYCID